MMECCDYIDPETGEVCGGPAELGIISLCPLRESISLCSDKHSGISAQEIDALMIAKAESTMRRLNFESALGQPTVLEAVEYRASPSPQNNWIRFVYDRRFDPIVEGQYPGFVSVQSMN